MTDFHVHLESPIAQSFRCVRAANSLDIDVAKKSVHDLEIRDADVTSPFTIGLIVGASGSGKSTLAAHMYGADCFKTLLDLARPVIDQFPDSMDYDACAAALAGVGLTSVPCWIRPGYTLSNGQRARAEAALQIAQMSADQTTTILLDEWTSVVDRVVARVMSHCIQKHARRIGARVVIASCHYDVIEWLNPDWVIDCNRASYENRRSLHPDERERTERLSFDIREVDKHTWRYFSKYHYLSARLPGGRLYTYGLFCGVDQIGFLCFANYVPTRAKQIPIYHSNRLVIHPDYAGLGLGVRFMNVACIHMAQRPEGYRIMTKFSSTPVYRALVKDPLWRLQEIKRKIGRTVKGGKMQRITGFRENVTTYSFDFVGQHSTRGGE